MDVRTIELTAGVPVRQRIPHRFFMLISTGAALQVSKLAHGTLSLTGEVGRNVEAGFKYFPLNPANESERWGGYELLSAFDQSVAVAVSDFAGDYARLVQVFELNPGATLASVADVTTIGAAAVLLTAASATVKRVHVKALLANTAPIRVGDNAITAARGLELQPGEGVTIQTAGAVYAIRASGAGDQSASMLQERV